MSQLENLPTISAEELHKILVTSNRIEHCSRYKFIRALLALEETRLFLDLGFSSTFQYAERHFGYQRTQTYELLRVARALGDLPRSLERFLEGKLSWSALQEVTRVASAETEEEWLDFAAKRSFQSLKAEVQDAQKKGRGRPRSDRYGLPALKTRIFFELDSEEHDLVQKAFEKLKAEMSECLGGERVEPKDVFLLMARRMLETDVAGTPPERVEREESLYTILYHRCPQCRASHVITDKGPAEVPPESIKRVEAEARKVEITPEEEKAVPAPADPLDIDRPNPPALARKVKLRDGDSCANPHCRRKVGLHAHHIEIRSQGGRTALYNLVTVCSICHSLAHEGRLSVWGDAMGTLTWSTRSDEIRIEPAVELKELAETPLVAVRSSGTPDGVSGIPDKAEDDAYLALLSLHFSKDEAQSRLKSARERLRAVGTPITTAELVRQAMSRSRSRN